jgi:hypothetical protein
MQKKPMEDAKLNDYEKHRVLVKNRRKTFYANFSIEEQDLLERELIKWPCYANGNPFPKVRDKFMFLLNLDPKHPNARELCNLWFEYVGWSIVGRRSSVDEKGTVWGESPTPGVTEKYPYSHAAYDAETDQWLLPENHSLYYTFHETFQDSIDRDYMKRLR